MNNKFNLVYVIPVLISYEEIRISLGRLLINDVNKQCYHKSIFEFYYKLVKIMC
jgi:hypothetical protein